MSLKHALLGFLNYRSMTGYQLKQHFDESVRNFWNASLSQIYPTLSQMKDEGLLTMEIKYQDSSPNAKVYQITDRGRTELQRWLAEPMESQPYRNAFLVKIFFGANIDDRDAIIAQLKQHLERCEQKLENFRGVLNQLAAARSGESLSRDAVFWSLTVDFGIKSEEAAIAWYRESIKKLEEMKEAEQHQGEEVR
jgi:PadR family transcriptional regulator AphA